MKLSFAFCATLSLLLHATALPAATFTVDIAADDADAHDVNPGNGVCADNFGSCTLRAALEEANARAGADVIAFADAFTNVNLVINATEGPLPPITGRITLLGSSIDAYNSSATLLRDAPPQFFINGSALPGGSASGLVFTGSGASGSIVSAIGIVGFPGNGILAAFGADDLIIERNFIGVGANGSAAGNGGHGFHASSSGGHRIGKARNGTGTAFTSLGNVLSSNGLSGVRLESSNDNDLRGNLIGISPSGTGDRGNGAYGVQISGTGNDIGDYITSASAGNFIAGNNLGGVFSVGNSNRFYANTLGKGETGSFIDSEVDGIVVIGDTNFIGNSGRGRNRIYEHTAGKAIRLGVAGGSGANSNFVLNNEIGGAGTAVASYYSSNGAGIVVDKGNTNAILDNIVINSQGSKSAGQGNGIRVVGDSNTVSGNQVGFVDSPSGPLAEPNRQGISVEGNNNTIGSAASRNQVGANAGVGIGATGSGNIVRYNYIGVTDSYAKISNATTGLSLINGSGVRAENNFIGHNERAGMVLFNISNSIFLSGNFIGVTPTGSNMGNEGAGVRVYNSSNSDLQQNRIAYNGRNGIETDDESSGMAWFQNSMYENGGIGIDLDSDGVTPNDPGDVDEGPNRLQNFPVIQSALLDTVAFPPTLTISYRVDSNAGESAYPLFVDFYWSDMDESAQGRFFLGTDFAYSTPNALRTITLNFIDGVPGGWLTATALDQDRNTSELATRFQFGTPFDRIFADGFE